MNIIINQAILHILDTNISTPVLSDNLLPEDGTVKGFLKEHIGNSFQSDNIKHCSFLENSKFFGILESSNGDFTAFSKQIANEFFSVMQKNVDIVSADLIVADVTIDEASYIGVFKLNYKNSFIHLYTQEDGANCNSIINQRTVLPSSGSKIDEFFFINTETSDIILAEKKYEINGAKDFYISSLILECTQDKCEKTKFNEVKKIAEKALKTHYTDDKMIDAAVSTMLVEETAESNMLEVEKLKERMEKVFPLAKETFAQQIEEKQMADQKIYVAESSAKRLEKQSIRTKNGVVINIPLNLMNDDNVEFINNPDGSVSILIKNVYM